MSGGKQHTFDLDVMRKLLNGEKVSYYVPDNQRLFEAERRLKKIFDLAGVELPSGLLSWHLPPTAGKSHIFTPEQSDV